MVVDASVVVSRLVAHDVNHDASRRWLMRHVADGGLIIAPTLLLPEVAGAIAADLRLPLVTWDAEQHDRGARLVEVRAPRPDA